MGNCGNCQNNTNNILNFSAITNGQHFFEFGGVDFIPLFVVRNAVGISLEEQDTVLKILTKTEGVFLEDIHWSRFFKYDLIEIIQDEELLRLFGNLDPDMQELLCISEAGVCLYIRGIHWLHNEAAMSQLFKRAPKKKERHLKLL